ncbi:MAG TPA: hypothetical protein EYP04_00100, partial [Anaerolineae bacterium]|nr:hypothetical protein [Anaerolineae bacterium]
MECPLKTAPAVERPWLPPQGEWTYEDYLRLFDDGWQYEIIKGELYMVPAPSTFHQEIVGNLGGFISNFIRSGAERIQGSHGRGNG